MRDAMPEEHGVLMSGTDKHNAKMARGVIESRICKLQANIDLGMTMRQDVCLGIRSVAAISWLPSWQQHQAPPLLLAKPFTS